MKTQRLKLITLTIAFFMVAQPIYADSLEAHMHGLSELTIAMENQTLEIQLISPAINLIGFEHKARTKEEIAAVSDVLDQLRDHKTLFAFSGANCSHVETSIDVASLIDSDNHKNSTKHDEHEHEHEHEHEYDDDHEEHAENNSHSNIIANYQLFCENKPSLASITVDLFDAFPATHKIQVMWVVQTRQGAVTLTANKRKIEFK